MFLDMHNHLVYGVDDGAPDFETTKELLREAVQDGAAGVIVTPHVTPGIVQFPEEKYRQNLYQAATWCKQEGLPIVLYPGAEVFYTEGTPRLLSEGKVPTLAGSYHVLVEFSPDAPYDRLYDAARQIGNAGYVPVFAHIERYACLRRQERIAELRNLFHVRMQINARTYIRKQGFFTKRWLACVTGGGLVDYVASDTHSMEGRRSCLRKAAEQLEALYGTGMARRLMVENPMELLPGGAIK